MGLYSKGVYAVTTVGEGSPSAYALSSLLENI